MIKDNPYFVMAEFKCKCGKCILPKGMPPDELIDLLCEIREHFKNPLIINSAYRCKSHNAKIGGAKLSRHTFGDAVDFTIKGVKTEHIYNYVIEKWGDRNYGIAIKRRRENPYAGFVHLDVRGDKKARWEYK